jgi:hypothetical protein
VLAQFGAGSTGSMAGMEIARVCCCTTSSPTRPRNKAEPIFHSLVPHETSRLRKLFLISDAATALTIRLLELIYLRRVWLGRDSIDMIQLITIFATSKLLSRTVQLDSRSAYGSESSGIKMHSEHEHELITSVQVSRNRVTLKELGV